MCPVLSCIHITFKGLLCKLISELLKYSKWTWGWNMKGEPFGLKTHCYWNENKITRGRGGGGGGGWYWGIKALTPATVKRSNSKNVLKITYSRVNTCFASKGTFTKLVVNFHCSSVTIIIISLFLLFLAWGSIIVCPQCSDHWKAAWKENHCTEKSNVWPGAVLHHNQSPNVYPCYNVFLFLPL